MTEKEILQAQERQIFTIERLLNRKDISLSDLEEILPALFHINSPEDSTLVYCSQAGLDFMQYEPEELLPYSAEQLASIISPDTQKYVLPKFIEFYQEENYYKVFAAFQQVKQRYKEGYTWVYTTTKIYKKLQAPISISIPLPQMGSVAHQIKGILEDNMFMRKNYQRFATLTKREMEILRLVVIGRKRNHIAEQLNISLHTYDTHRKNIRTKLEAKSLADLMRYARAFGVMD